MKVNIEITEKMAIDHDLCGEDARCDGCSCRMGEDGCIYDYVEPDKKCYEVVTLCGSTRFKDDFIKVQKALTLKGCIVISVGLFGHSGDTITDEQKIMLDDMHKRKIDMADTVFVINKDGYIGPSTASEIEYAESTGKTVAYLEGCGSYEGTEDDIFSDLYWLDYRQRVRN